MQEWNPEQWDKNVFEAIGKQWMLITAGGEKVNTMTASWGGMGVLWGKKVVYAFIRPQRYTKEFVDGSDTFSLSFLGEEYRKQLQYLGKASGRDEDKIKISGLTVAREGNTPYFSEAEAVLVCKKLYAQELNPECFVTAGEDEMWYPQKDYHTMYVGEITKLLVK